MPWIKVKISPFVWLKRDKGPPPSCRIAIFHVSWFDWDAFAAEASAKADRYRHALEAARQELRK